MKLKDEFTSDKQELKRKIIEFCSKYHIGKFEIDVKFIECRDAHSAPLDVESLIEYINFNIKI